MKISVVIPVYNEAPALPELFSRIASALSAVSYEIIAVNDGSRDDSWDVLRKLAEKDPRVKAVNFGRNAGQTAALSAGIARATGDVVMPIDSDLENDPADMVRLLQKLEEGYDVVSGWRKDRWADSALSRRLPSHVANWLISKITGVHLHDYGCTLKAYRRDVLMGVQLYGEMHRFIPAYASWKGARVTEIPVSYVPRPYGVSNYGISRTFRVLLDLVLIKFLTKYMNRPIHFFGGIGFLSLLFGTLFALVAVGLKLAGLRSFVATPLPIFSALFVIVGVQLIAMGVVAEMVMRTYYESQGKTPYQVKETVNF